MNYETLYVRCSERNFHVRIKTLKRDNRILNNNSHFKHQRFKKRILQNNFILTGANHLRTGMY